MRIFTAIIRRISYIYLYEKCMMPEENQSLPLKCINRLKRVQRDRIINRIINNASFDIAVSIKEGGAMKYVAGLKAARRVAWIHTDYSVLHWSAAENLNRSLSRSLLDVMSRM